MALSVEKLEDLKAALFAVDDHFTKRLNEIDREVRNLRERGSPIAALGKNTTETGTDGALAILDSVGV